MKTWGATAVVLGALLLAGCAGTSPAQTADERRTIEPSSTVPAAAPITQAPGTTAPTNGYQIDEATYLRGLKAAWHGTPPADSELISAARFVCAQRQAGVASDEIVAVSGEDEDAEWNNMKVVTYGVQLFCPELDED